MRDLHIYPGPSEGGQVVRSASRLVVLGEMWGKVRGAPWRRVTIIPEPGAVGALLVWR